MTDASPPTPEAIRAARAADPKTRERDFAAKLGISEAALLAAYVGQGVTRIAAHPDRLLPLVQRLGAVMGLTRNESCVIEKVGRYDNFRPGEHAALVVNDDIDLRLFPGHWVHGFAVEREVEGGTRRSLQVFDAAGDAVHKVFLREGSDASAWPEVVAALRLDDQSPAFAAEPRAPVEGAKERPDRADELRAGWDRMTDTHQFLRLVSRLKTNRLGAYRVVGAPYARRLTSGAVERLLYAVAGAEVPFMIFVGNRGCIEIHGGPIRNVKPMGPWINILDPGFDLHLRSDHIAEIWAVTKPTDRGAAVSVEFFDAEGGLIAQMFGLRRAGDDAVARWDALVAAEETAEEVQA